MFAEMIESLSDQVLFASCIFIVFGSLFISFKIGFIQIRFFPALFRMIRQSLSQKSRDHFTIVPHKALLTAMSTTIGVGTIVGPVIAIHLGGPGALLGFMLTSLLGSASTFMEVNLCIKFRKRLPSGQILGGPMHYLSTLFSPFAARWYAVCCCILMTAWSSAQANQLASMLNSPLLGAYRIPTTVSGVLIALFVIMILIGGIKRVSEFSAKIVPLMFALYLGGSFWILFSNLDQLWPVCCTVFQSAFTPYAMASGTLVGGIVSALRWGVYKGTQATEAGVGTQTIPHSMAETNNPTEQGMLAMVSTYSAGAISIISGCIALITGTWQDPDLPLGMSMVAASFQMYFPAYGVTIVALSTLLFAFSTILGNSYNGSQCFLYMTQNKKLYYYYAATAVIIFMGTISGTKLVWSVIDFILAFMVVPHMACLMIYAHRNADEIVKENALKLSTSTS